MKASFLESLRLDAASRIALCVLIEAIDIASKLRTFHVAEPISLLVGSHSEGKAPLLELR